MWIATASCLFAATAGLRLSAQVEKAAVPTVAQVEFFEANIRPVLIDTCGECHTDDEDGDLRTDSRDALLKGGETGPAIVPGEPEKSLLVHVIRRDEGFPRMPKSKPKLPAATVAAFVEWIKQGAPWPADKPGAPKPAAAPAPASTITAEQRAWWAFTPIAEEVDAFVADTAPDAFAKVVDRLLASPRYGEAWGRQWLDVARYAEDDPRSLDPMGRGFNPYPNAYLYRDWVVKAFNDDLPYDQFVRAQLAADHLDETQRVKMLPAIERPVACARSTRDDSPSARHRSH